MPPTPQAKIANCDSREVGRLSYTQMDQRNREKMYENQKNQPTPVRNQNVKSWYMKCSMPGGGDDDDSDVSSLPDGDPDDDEALRHRIADEDL